MAILKIRTAFDECGVIRVKINCRPQKKEIKTKQIKTQRGCSRDQAI